MIIRNRNILESGVPDTKAVLGCLKEFRDGLPRLERLERYYKNENDILGRRRERKLPNNRLSHAFAQYIVSVASGYLVGSPVQYAADTDITAVLEVLRRSKMSSVDSELAESASIYGVGVELLYLNENGLVKSAKVDRRNAFVVYDDSVESRPLLGIRWIGQKMEGSKAYKVFVYTEREVYTYETSTLDSLPEAEEPSLHFFEGVPLVEYWNNGLEMGDFEGVLSLIDAYDLLQSDRLNDKQQFVDSLLVLAGVNDIESDEEEDSKSSTMELLKRKKILLIPPDGRAEYLYKQLNEADVEVLSKSIASDIHKFSRVPDLTDENFAGNASGVAMKYKLFGLEQLTKIKERWFEEGLRLRLGLICNLLRLKGKPAPDAEDIQVTFSRSLPVNELEIAQMVRTLAGLVPEENLLAQVPFVKDVGLALETLEKERSGEPEQIDGV